MSTLRCRWPEHALLRCRERTESRYLPALRRASGTRPLRSVDPSLTLYAVRAGVVCRTRPSPFGPAPARNNSGPSMLQPGGLLSSGACVPSPLVRACLSPLLDRLGREMNARALGYDCDCGWCAWCETLAICAVRVCTVLNLSKRSSPSHSFCALLRVKSCVSLTHHRS